MANNITVTPGAGATIACDEFTDATLGLSKFQNVKIVDGTTGSGNRWVISASGAAKVDPSGVTSPVSLAALPALSAGAAAIGTVGVTSLPSIPAGANAIGTVSVTGTVALSALPTGANTIGTVVLQLYTVAAQITPGTPVAAGRGVLINCTAAGLQALKLAGGATVLVPVNLGASILDGWSITDAPVAGTTATCIVTALS